MKTARMSSETGVTWGVEGSHTYSNAVMIDASETAINAYAQQILESHAMAREQPVPDESLGPYVASVLRHNSGDIVDMPDYDGLLELLQEHCGIFSAPEALAALQEISRAVTQRQVPAPEQFETRAAALFPAALPPVSLQPQEPKPIAKLVVTTEDEDEFPSLSSATALPSKSPGHASLISPNKADSLLPQDLLDEDGDSQKSALEEKVSHVKTRHDPVVTGGKKQSRSGNGKKSQPASDLAAALFRPSRSRLSDADECTPVTVDSAPSTATDFYVEPEHFENATNLLLSMNPDLSFEAAHAAAVLAQADSNIAQFVIQSALVAPPICRHLLQSGCYRSDCQFSHNISTHTCIFWIRGRCGKGEACKFLHGFHESLLPQTAMVYDESSFYGSESYGYSQSPMWPQSSSSAVQSHSYAKSGAGSFANIAYQGYNRTTSYSQPSKSNTAYKGNTDSAPTVRIPQDMWNPHESRDSAAFHIENPMERYRVVMSMAYHHESVIDLHFQSIKTFPVVLEQVLPERLEKSDQIWVVTGTGHHVGTRTHQKGGGALESAVLEWLLQRGYNVYRGRDKNGQGGALLIKRQVW